MSIANEDHSAGWSVNSTDNICGPADPRLPSNPTSLRS
jgi:hypothetical protein